MTNWSRRSVLGTGTVLTTSGLFASSTSGKSTGATQSLEEPDGWSSYRGGVGNTASVAAEGAFPEPETVDWEYDEEGELAAVDGTVYIQTGNEVHALDDEDGTLLWESDDVSASGPPAVANETVYVSGEEVTALEVSSGEVRWTDGVDGDEGTTPPVVGYGLVYVVSDGELLAIDADDGAPAWSRETADLELSGDTESGTFEPVPVALSNGFVYGALSTGETVGLVALDATTGDTAWTFVDEQSWENLEYVTATEERVYTGSIDDASVENYPVLDAETGEETDRVGFRFPPAVTSGAHASVNRTDFSVSNDESGDDWGEDGSMTDSWRQPTIVGETLILPYYPNDPEVNALYGFDLETGDEQWSFSHEDIDIGDLSGQYVVSEDTVYIPGDGKITAVRPSHDGEGDDEQDGDDEDQPEEDEQNEDEQEEVEQEGDGQSGDDTADEAEGGQESGNESQQDEEEAADSGETNETVEEDNDDTSDEDGGGEDGENDDPSADAGEGVEADNESDATNGADNETDDSGNETNGSGNETDDTGNETEDTDETPGFTTGAGLVSGALGLEWLRRRAGSGEPEGRTD